MRVLLVAVVAAVTLAACEKSRGPDRSPEVVAKEAPAKPEPTPPKSAEAVIAEAPGASANPKLAAPSPHEFERLMEQAVAMFKAMGDVAERSGGNCEKVAEGIDRVMVDYKDFLAQAKRYKDNPEIDKMGEAWMKEHQDLVMKPMMQVAAAGQKCAANARFMQTMERLAELGN